MQFSRLARIRAEVTRALGSAAIGASAIRTRLAKWRGKTIEGCTVDDHLAAMLAFDDVLNASDFRRRTPPKARAQMAESVSTVEERIPDGVFVHDLRCKGGAGPLDARRYVPNGLAAPSPAVVFFHGGGFVTGDLDTHDSLCRRIALESRVRVIAVDYRLAPENPFPAPVDDGVAAFRDIAARSAELGIDPSRIAVMGDSAGGNLSAVVAGKTRNDAIRPALQALVYPALDATCSHRSQLVYAEGFMLTKGMIDWYYTHYLGDDAAQRRHPDASPLLASSVEGLPPALVYTAGFDPLRDEGAAYVERLSAASVPAKLVCFDALIHGFTLMGGLAPAAKEATARIAREVGEALREGFG